MVESGGGESFGGGGRGGCQVDDPAADAGVGVQDFDEQRSVAAADVDDVGKPAPVEAFGDLRCLFPESPVHLVVE